MKPSIFACTKRSRLTAWAVKRKEILFCAIGLSLMVARSVSAADAITLEDARLASVEASSIPESGRCVGRFRATGQGSDDETAATWTAGVFRLSYASNKVYLAVEFSKLRVVTRAPDGSVVKSEIVDSGMERVVILGDGDTIRKIRFSPRIRPSGCRIELYSTLREALAASDFPLQHPVRPQLEVLDIDKLIQNIGVDAIEWSPYKGSLFKGTYNAKNSSRVRAEFFVDAAKGNRLISHVAYNIPSETPAVSHHLTWEEKDQAWYVQRYSSTNRYPDGLVEEAEFVFTDFQPGVEFDRNLLKQFTNSIPPDARTIDRR